jgi:hypothetical protein
LFALLAIIQFGGMREFVLRLDLKYFDSIPQKILNHPLTRIERNCLFAQRYLLLLLASRLPDPSSLSRHAPDQPRQILVSSALAYQRSKNS